MPVRRAGNSHNANKPLEIRFAFRARKGRIIRQGTPRTSFKSEAYLPNPFVGSVLPRLNYVPRRGLVNKLMNLRRGMEINIFTDAVCHNYPSAFPESINSGPITVLPVRFIEARACVLFIPSHLRHRMN